MADDVTTIEQDKHIICRTCGNEFIFSVDKQRRFAAAGYKDPKDCFYCGQQKKQQRQGGNMVTGTVAATGPGFQRQAAPVNRDQAMAQNFNDLYGGGNGRDRRGNGGGGGDWDKKKRKGGGHGSDRRRGGRRGDFDSAWDD